MDRQTDGDEIASLEKGKANESTTGRGEDKDSSTQIGSTVNYGQNGTENSESKRSETTDGENNEHEESLHREEKNERRTRGPRGHQSSRASAGGTTAPEGKKGKDEKAGSADGSGGAEDPGTECRRLQRTYSVRPCISWGDAARRSDIQERWTELDCDTQLGVICQVAGADAPPEALPGTDDLELGRRHLMTARGWDGVGGSSDFRSMEEALEAARQLLEKADAVGNGGATYLLGEMAEFGEGVADKGDEPDEAAAARLYASAAARKSPEARYAVADRLAASLSSPWICAQCAVRDGVSDGSSSGGSKHADPAGQTAVLEALISAARRGSTLALLALSAKDYEAALGGAGGPEAESRCEAAFQYLRPAADAAVKAIQESGGGAAETEQVVAHATARVHAPQCAT